MGEIRDENDPYWKKCSICSSEEGPFIFEVGTGHKWGEEAVKVSLPKDMTLAPGESRYDTQHFYLHLKSFSSLFQVVCLPCLKRAVLFGKLEVISWE